MQYPYLFAIIDLLGQVCMRSERLPEAMEYPCGPEAGSARHAAGVAVGAELLAVHVVAKRHVAVVAEGIIVLQNLSAKCACGRAVPNCEYVLLREVTERHRLHLLREPPIWQL